MSSYGKNKGKELRRAAKYGEVDKVKSILESAEFDVNCSDVNGSVLHYAVSHDQIECVNAILAHDGIKLNVKDNGGNTPLHKAAEAGLADIAKLLLESGAKVSMKNEDGCTPLDIAAEGDWSGVQYEHLLVSRLLVQHGAKRKRKRNDVKRIDMLIRDWMNSVNTGERSKQNLALPPKSLWSKGEKSFEEFVVFLDKQRSQYIDELTFDDVYMELRLRAAYDKHTKSSESDSESKDDPATLKGDSLPAAFDDVSMGEKARVKLPKTTLEEGISTFDDFVNLYNGLCESVPFGVLVSESTPPPRPPSESEE